MPSNITLPELGAWQANHIRLIAFTREPAFSAARDWWEELVGTQPEENSEKKAKQQFESSGPVDGVNLVMNTDLMRILWTAQPLINLEDGLSGVPLIGQYQQRMKWLLELMKKWLIKCPPTVRIAINASLHQTVNNREEGYCLLNNYLQWVEIDPASKDFSYRINRPCESRTGVKELSINRLQSWAVARHQFTLVTALPGTGQQAEQLSEAYSCKLELDINTVVPYGPEVLPHERLFEIVNELAEFGSQIAEEGDVKP